MFHHSFLRPVVGLPLAALVVFGLFSFMQRMIAVDFEPPVVTEQRTLVKFTAPEEKTDTLQTRRPVTKLPEVKEPPPPPKVSATRSDIDLPAPVIRGAAPAELDIGQLKMLAVAPVNINDHDAQPIRPPLPVYPDSAAARGLDGLCEVRFDVDTRGRPFDVEATCTDSIFKRSAEQAVRKSEFAPKIERGQAKERRNVVYPIEFKIG